MGASEGTFDFDLELKKRSSLATIVDKNSYTFNCHLPDTQALPRWLRACVEHRLRRADLELKLFSASPATEPAAAFVHVDGAPTASCFLHADFASVLLLEALPTDLTLGQIAAAA